jgi:TolB protein
MFAGLLFANDATIEVIKKADTVPSIAAEDATSDYDETFRLRFFKMLVADLNVISIFNVDRHHRINEFNDDVLVENKDMDYVLHYKLSEGDSGALDVQIKLLHKGEDVYSKSYRVGKKSIYMFVSHAIAYDINEFMGEPSVAWMKRKVIFSRIVAPKKE